MSEQYPESSPRVDSFLSRLIVELKDANEYNTASVSSADPDAGFQWPNFDLTVRLEASQVYRLERLSSLYQTQKNRLASWLLSELLDDLYDSEHSLLANIPDPDRESEYVDALYQIDRWSRWRDSMRDGWRSLDASNRDRRYVDRLPLEPEQETENASALE